jgi:hypothetical protein
MRRAQPFLDAMMRSCNIQLVMMARPTLPRCYGGTPEHPTSLPSWRAAPEAGGVAPTRCATQDLSKYCPTCMSVTWDDPDFKTWLYNAECAPPTRWPLRERASVAAAAASCHGTLLTILDHS